MDAAAVEKIRTLLREGQVDGVLALKEVHGHVGPHLFTDLRDLDLLYRGDRSPGRTVRYPMADIARRLLRDHPHLRLAVLVRGCDDRALKALAAWNQLDMERVLTVGLVCPPELATACACRHPYPEEHREEASQPAPEERDTGKVPWMEAFQRCIKCFGCRNVCPLCTCTECALEDEQMVPKGLLPPAFPIFHLIRAVHTIGRCVDCGLCEEACPADIPLRTLYKMVQRIVRDRFGFETGLDATVKSPLHRIQEPPPTR